MSAFLRAKRVVHPVADAASNAASVLMVEVACEEEGFPQISALAAEDRDTVLNDCYVIEAHRAVAVEDRLIHGAQSPSHLG